MSFLLGFYVYLLYYWEANGMFLLSLMRIFLSFGVSLKGIEDILNNFYPSFTLFIKQKHNNREEMSYNPEAQTINPFNIIHICLITLG